MTAPTLFHCSQFTQQLFDEIGKLRHLGVPLEVDLPQLVVVGSQSSGKSSVIDAISRLHVPKKASVCTRFALEIVLRRTDEVSWSVELLPCDTRSADERQLLKTFGAAIKSRVKDPEKELGDIITQAEQALGLSSTKDGASFAQDVLRLSWFGPEMLDLDLVDLPGLFHGEGKNQSTTDIPLVKELVEMYMARPSTIILMVISARDNLANQQVTSLVSIHDRERERTLGIITKPDAVDGPEALVEVIDLATNQTYSLRHGYHILMNRNWQTQSSSHQARDDAEAEYLARPEFSRVEATCKGRAALGPKLTQLYQDQILRSLPIIVEKVQAAIQRLQTELTSQGAQGSPTASNRMRLNEIGHKAIVTFRDAIDGRLDADLLSQLGERVRIRPKIEKLLEMFRTELQHQGNDDGGVTEQFAPISSVENMTQADLALAQVVLADYVPPTLPGQFDQALAARLCRTATEAWHVTTEKLIESIVAVVDECLLALLGFVCHEKTARAIYDIVWLPVAGQLQSDFAAAAERTLPRFEATSARHDFAESTLRKAIEIARVKEKARLFMRLSRTSSQPDVFYNEAKLQQLIQQESPAVSTGVYEAIECMRIHCREEVKRLAAYYSVFHINRTLAERFNASFTTRSFADLSDSQVDHIFGENDEARQRRQLLQNQIEDLTLILTRLIGLGPSTMTDDLSASNLQA